MNDAAITDCGGTFTDGDGDYVDDATLITTLCPDGTAGTHVRLSFQNFEIAVGDSLFFYDGTTVDPDSLLGTLNDFGKSDAGSIRGEGFILQATAANPSGCLTLVFQPTNDGLTAEGWEAFLSCGAACQNLFVELTDADPAIMPADTGYIDLCPGQEIRLSAGGIYPQSGVVYPQSDAQTTFEWTMDDGSILQGQDIVHSYSEPGGYFIRLKATDQNGCTNLNLLSQRVRVAPPPSFETDVPYPVCLGDTIALTISEQAAADPNVLIQPGTSGFPINGVRSDSLPLPDGISSYKTSLTIEDFPQDRVLENPEDLAGICLNIEHSYLFDLDIVITCPNGQSDTLQRTNLLSGQVSTLGEPYEADDGQNTGTSGHIPGIGYNYCFTTDADFTWNEFITANGPGQLPAGDYLPVQGFEELVGCPINGEWTLEVADRIVDDNGWIFEWGINFANRLLPFADPFSPAITDYSWSNNSEIDFYTADSIATYTDVAGDITYQLTATDDFGCSWDTSVVVSVLPDNHPDCYECPQLLRREEDILICNPESRQLNVANDALALETPVTYTATPGVAFGFDNAPPADPLELTIAAGNVVPTVVTDPAAQILSICVDLATDRVGDIDLFLRAPSGQLLELSTNNGGNNANGYNQVCFTPNATTAIDLSFPPYTGDYLPEGDFTDLTGASITGDWTLIVADEAGTGTSGVVNSWSISFQSSNEVSYSWSPTFGLNCIECPDPLAAPSATTNYVVRATDLFGCEDRDTIIVAIAADLPEPQISCETTANGEITFTWEKVENFSLYDVRFTRNGASAPWEGPVTYLSYLVDGLQLSDTVSLDLRVFADPNATSCDNPQVRATCVYSICVHEGQIEEVTPVSCADREDGTISINGINGIAPYRYFLDNDTLGQDAGFFAGLSSGNHIVVIEDQTGCRDTTAFEVPAPLPLTLTIERERAVSCPDGDDGILRGMVSGGTGPYSFDWTGIGQGDTSTVTGLSPGTYQLQVSDQNGCMAAAEFTLGNPGGIQIDLNPVMPSCSDTQDGAIMATVSGGTPDYSFLWDNGATVAEPDNLAAGEYCLTVTDGRGCIETACATIQAPDPVVLDSIRVQPAECFGTNTGSATAFASGGSGNYTFLWNDDLQQISQQALRLSAGAYRVDIIDENNCRISTQVEVPEPDPLTAITSAQDARCFGGTDGLASVTVSGGNAPYTYLWPSGGSEAEEPELSSGAYEVSITDANGCATSAEVVVGEPDSPVSVVATQIAQGCPGSEQNEVEAVAAGGSGTGYSYRWNDPAQQSGPVATTLDSITYIVTATDSEGCTGLDTIKLNDLPAITIGIIANAPTCSNTSDGRLGVNQVEGGIGGGDPNNYRFLWSTGATGLTINDLAGNREYAVTATDDRGCTGVQSRFLPQPDTIAYEVEILNVSCNQGNDGSASVINIVGNNDDFSLQWSGSAGDQNGAELEGLRAGDYELTVTDASNCTNTALITIEEPPTVLLEVAVTDVSCFGNQDGRIELNIQGGTPPFQYSRNNIDFNGISTIIGLEAGGQVVYVRDAEGCLYVEPVTVGSPPEFLIDLGPDITMLLGDTLELEATLIDAAGDMADLFWSAPYAGTLSCEQCDRPRIWPQSSIVYTATAYDSNGCEAQDQIRVTVEKPRSVLVPTGFTPNDDQTNDRLIVHGGEGTRIKVFRIFDRWGELLYEKFDFPVNDPEAGWDGTFRGQPLQSGVYIWYLEAVYPFDQEEQRFQGQTTLIR